MSPKKPPLTLLLLGSVLSLLFLTPSQSAANTAMQDYVNAMQPGTNLGNTLDAIPVETSWGAPYTTQAIIQGIAAQGYKSIRIPVTWKDHMGAAPNYTIDQAWMDRVQQIVDWSLDAGLYVMLNSHHDSWEWLSAMPSNHDAVLDRYKKMWTQIATRFRDHSNKLMFESINEPGFDGVDDATKRILLDEVNTAFFNVVRGSGGGNAVRPLVLPSVNTSADQPMLDSLKATMAHLNDSNLIATVHYYGWYPFSVNLGGYTRFDETSVQWIKTPFNAVHDTFVANGIPVVVGEFGLLAGDHVERGEVLKYYEYVVQYAHSKNLTHMLWDTGGVFDRTSLQWHDSELGTIMKQAWTGRATTAESDLLFLQDGAPIRDAVINLNLNGNTLVSLKDGTTLLTPDTDYTLRGNVLTIKSAVLSNHATGSFGEKTTLTVSVNSGPDWTIHVRYAATPAQSAATGTKGNYLWIPTTFNGDLLATIQSTYSDGSNAGPTSWTSFQPFGDAFWPDYVNNGVALNKTFFQDAHAGTVNFTCFFWSGRVTKFQFVIDSSGGITGKPLPVYPDYDWAPFTTGVNSSWTPPARANTSAATFSAVGLPTWASIDPATGKISGTPTDAAGTMTQATVTASIAGLPVATFKVNVVAASAGSDLAPVNMSTRARVGSGDQILIPGFVVGGSTPRKFLIRAVGPTISDRVTGTLADPTLTVCDRNGVALSSNDNWGDATNLTELRAAITSSGAFALNEGSKDAAMLLTLDPGIYTAKASGTNGTTGVSLVELYDVTGSNAGSSSLVNISTRAYVGVGDDVVIPGIVLNGGGTRRLLVRAVGPTLSRYNVDGVLIDPQITLMKGSTALASNDDWCVGNDSSEIEAVAASVGAFPLPIDSRDSVLLTSLPSGAFTVVLRGNGNTTGVALVEVYVVP